MFIPAATQRARGSASSDAGPMVDTSFTRRGGLDAEQRCRAWASGATARLIASSIACRSCRFLRIPVLYRTRDRILPPAQSGIDRAGRPASRGSRTLVTRRVGMRRSEALVASIATLYEHTDGGATRIGTLVASSTVHTSPSYFSSTTVPSAWGFGVALLLFLG